MLNKLKLTQTKFRLNGKEINLTADNTIITSNNFNVDRSGNMSCNNAIITGGILNLTGDDITPTITITDGNTDELEMYPSNFYMRYYDYGSNAIIGQYLQKGGYYVENESTGQSTKVWYNGIITPTVTQTSLESQKKNFKKFNNALDILKNIDIYEYNLKSEKDNDKKHIGFVIGDKFKYSKEVTSKDNDGVDTYSFISVCCKAIQEQQEMIEQLQEKIKELEEK